MLRKAGKGESEEMGIKSAAAGAGAGNCWELLGAFYRNFIGMLPSRRQRLRLLENLPLGLEGGKGSIPSSGKPGSKDLPALLGGGAAGWS